MVTGVQDFHVKKPQCQYPNLEWSTCLTQEIERNERVCVRESIYNTPTQKIINKSGNTKRGSITVLLTSCLTIFDFA